LKPFLKREMAFLILYGFSMDFVSVKTLKLLAIMQSLDSDKPVMVL